MSQSKKKIAFTVGVFDCFHEGHAELIQRMKARADRVIVMIHDDLSTYRNKKRFPIQETRLRRHNLELVTRETIYITEAQNPRKDIRWLVSKMVERGWIKDLSEIVFMRGDDWKDFPGKEEIEELGIDIEFKKYKKGISTSKIRKSL